MSPMSDQPVTLAVLAQFHSEIILPDLERVVRESEFRLRNEMQTFHDEIVHKVNKLDSEYHLLTAGLARVEERLDRMDERFDRVEARLGSLERQYQELLAAFRRLEERLSSVEERLSRVEERLGGVEGQVDALVAAREKDPLRAEVADLRTRVDSLQAQMRSLEKRFEQ